MNNVTPELLAELKAKASGFGYGFDCVNVQRESEVGSMADDDFYPLFRINADHYDTDFGSVGVELAKFYAAANPATILALLAHIDSLAEQLADENAVSEQRRMALGEMIESRNMFQTEHLKECARLDWALEHSAHIYDNNVMGYWPDDSDDSTPAEIDTTNPRATIDALMKGE